MKNKGFTLMEILGSIIIISIIGVLAVVTFTRNMKGFREDYYIETVRTLTESGKEFFNDNKKYRPSDVLTSQIVPMNTLVSQKYLDEVSDYKGNSCSNSSYVIVIKNGKDDYTYHSCLVCPEDDFSNMDDKYCDDAWRTSTSIEYTIATPPELFVYLETPKSSLRELLAIKASYVKKNSKGEVIGVVDGTGFDDTPTIYPENFDTVDTNKIGVYPINYEYQGRTTTGHVTVYKFEEPNFSIKKQETYATDFHGNTTTSLKEMYISGTWTQKIFITLSAGESTAESMPNVVNRYQWNKDGVWQDFCLGTSCSDKEITIEMNEDIKFRSISVDNRISDETVITNIKIDNTKPACTLNKTGQQKTSDWYTSDVTVTFDRKEDLVKTSTESVSGVKYHNITISTGAFSHTNNSQAIHDYDTKGVTYIGYVEDQARNFITCDISFRRDATDPVCTLKTTGTRENASNPWYNSESVAIAFDTFYDLDDQGTAVNASYVKTTKITGNGHEHPNSIVDSADTDGVTYTGYVEDYAGNNTTCTISYKKDSTAPTCSLAKSGTVGDNSWYVSNVGISFSEAADNLSGVRNYGLGSTSGSKTATHSSDTTGTTYNGYIVDNAGNSNSCSTSFKRDATPPVCKTESTQAENSWTNSQVTLTGICQSDSGGSGCKNYKPTASFADEQAQAHSPGYAYDNAGNKDPCPYFTVRIDRTLPNISCSKTSTGSTAGVTVSVAANDDSGRYRSGFKSLTPQSFTIKSTTKYTASDYAGNTNSCTVSVESYSCEPHDCNCETCTDYSTCLSSTCNGYSCTGKAANCTGQGCPTCGTFTTKSACNGNTGCSWSCTGGWTCNSYRTYSCNCDTCYNTCYR